MSLLAEFFNGKVPVKEYTIGVKALVNFTLMDIPSKYFWSMFAHVTQDLLQGRQPGPFLA
jgi:hypothetical protein